MREKTFEMLEKEAAWPHQLKFLDMYKSIVFRSVTFFRGQCIDVFVFLLNIFLVAARIC